MAHTLTTLRASSYPTISPIESNGMAYLDAGVQATYHRLRRSKKGLPMPSTVYIETTIPSAYVTTRTDPASLFRRQITRNWWQEQGPRYAMITADNVVLELRTGDWEGKAEALALVEALPRLAIDAEVLAVAQRYVRERLIPSDLAGDAMHLAAACVHEVDYLLTWNIRHLANPNKTEHLVVINRRLGLLTPQIVTPEALWID